MTLRPMSRNHPVTLLLATVLAVTFAACARTPKDEEVRVMMQIVDISTKWVSKYYQPWPPRLILVPSISFRVKNLSNKPLEYVNFNAIFKFRDEEDNLGDHFLAAIRRRPVLPGELSPLITLKSNFGVEAKRLASFKNNPQWKLVEVKIFVQMRGSRHILLGKYDVSREIDFKEDEPVGIKKTN